MGWSVKKTLMGKTIYNDAGVKVGKVEDLIISPDKNVSYLIVGAGGFVGIGRHDVAIPVSQIQDKAGKLVLPGATKDTIKGMPEFAYAKDAGK
jgi:sporulation protein YlmC with PRC-barrel domain